MENMTVAAGHHALDRTLAQVGDRWTLLVVNALLEGPKRFNELQVGLPGIATNVLSQRLRRLEEVGVVIAHPYSTRPPRYAYELAAGGRELAGALRLLAQWGTERGSAEPPGPALEHASCGTPLETRYFCPTCDEVVDDETAQLRFV
jgi:DNA-binding HxlR family transcriptional regulator